MMFESLVGYYDYGLIIILMVIGLYGMVIKRNLVKKLIGMTIFQASIVLFYVAGAAKWGATVPVYTPAIPNENIGNYINPLPHTLMLTAIVVGVATTAVAFALLILIYDRFQTLDELELRKRMQ
jgi:multicomponent Na+:H+ antiporter subunit C